MVNVTARQARELMRNLKGVETKPKRKRKRIAPKQKRKVIMCAICGKALGEMSTHWTMDTWQVSRRATMVAAHLDCYIERMREIRNGEYSI